MLLCFDLAPPLLLTNLWTRLLFLHHYSIFPDYSILDLGYVAVVHLSLGFFGNGVFILEHDTPFEEQLSQLWIFFIWGIWLSSVISQLVWFLTGVLLCRKHIMRLGTNGGKS